MAAAEAGSATGGDGGELRCWVAKSDRRRRKWQTRWVSFDPTSTKFCVYDVDASKKAAKAKHTWLLSEVDLEAAKARKCCRALSKAVEARDAAAASAAAAGAAGAGTPTAKGKKGKKGEKGAGSGEDSDFSLASLLKFAVVDAVLPGKEVPAGKHPLSVLVSSQQGRVLSLAFDDERQRDTWVGALRLTLAAKHGGLLEGDGGDGGDGEPRTSVEEAVRQYRDVGGAALKPWHCIQHPVLRAAWKRHLGAQFVASKLDFAEMLQGCLSTPLPEEALTTILCCFTKPTASSIKISQADRMFTRADLTLDEAVERLLEQTSSDRLVTLPTRPRVFGYHAEMNDVCELFARALDRGTRVVGIHGGDLCGKTTFVSAVAHRLADTTAYPGGVLFTDVGNCTGTEAALHALASEVGAGMCEDIFESLMLWAGKLSSRLLLVVDGCNERSDVVPSDEFLQVAANLTSGASNLHMLVAGKVVAGTPTTAMGTVAKGRAVVVTLSGVDTQAAVNLTNAAALTEHQESIADSWKHAPGVLHLIARSGSHAPELARLLENASVRDARATIAQFSADNLSDQLRATAKTLLKMTSAFDAHQAARVLNGKVYARMVADEPLEATRRAKEVREMLSTLADVGLLKTAPHRGNAAARFVWTSQGRAAVRLDTAGVGAVAGSFAHWSPLVDLLNSARDILDAGHLATVFELMNREGDVVEIMMLEVEDASTSEQRHLAGKTLLHLEEVVHVLKLRTSRDKMLPFLKALVAVFDDSDAPRFLLAHARARIQMAWLLLDGAEVSPAASLVVTVMDKLAGLKGMRGVDEHQWKYTMAAAENTLGSVRYRQHDLDAANRHMSRALELRCELLGPGHPKSAGTLSNLGNVLRRQAKLPDSLDAYRRALDIQRQVLGVRHPHVANTLNSIGFSLELQQREGEAIEVYEKALEIRVRRFGYMSSATAQTLVSIGDLQYMIGEDEAALHMYQKALPARERILGPNHPTTADLLFNIGNVLKATSHHAEASVAYARAQSGYSEHFGPSSDQAETARHAAEEARTAADTPAKASAAGASPESASAASPPNETGTTSTSEHPRSTVASGSAKATPPPAPSSEDLEGAGSARAVPSTASTPVATDDADEQLVVIVEESDSDESEEAVAV